MVEGYRGVAGARGHLSADRRSRVGDRQGVRHAACRCRRHVRGAHPDGQRHRAQRVRDRPRQEDQGHPHLSDEHRAQLRRDSAAGRFLPTHRRQAGGDAGQLGAGRQGDHSAVGVGRGGQGDLPGRLGAAAALHPDSSRSRSRGTTCAASRPRGLPAGHRGCGRSRSSRIQSSRRSRGTRVAGRTSGRGGTVAGEPGAGAHQRPRGPTGAARTPGRASTLSPCRAGLPSQSRPARQPNAAQTGAAGCPRATTSARSRGAAACRHLPAGDRRNPTAPIRRRIPPCRGRRAR